MRTWARFKDLAIGDLFAMSPAAAKRGEAWRKISDNVARVVSEGPWSVTEEEMDPEHMVERVKDKEKRQMTKYQIWSNTSSDPERFFDGYKPEHSMKMSYEGEIDMEITQAVMNHLFMRFNQDDRPNGLVAHSLSVGDVIVVNGKAYTVDRMGFTQLDAFEPVIGDYE